MQNFFLIFKKLIKLTFSLYSTALIYFFLVFFIFKNLNIQTQQIHEETAEDNSISKELDKIRKQLKTAWKNSSQKDSIGYYEFVLNPTCFSKSVENMFYVSFLIKDGTVGVDVNPQTGLPFLSWFFYILN